MSDKLIGQIMKISNGYLFMNTETNETTYFKKMPWDGAFEDFSDVDPETKIAYIVSSFRPNQKIAAIKAVRQWCADNNNSKYYSLRDAKNLMENIRQDWDYNYIAE